MLCVLGLDMDTLSSHPIAVPSLCPGRKSRGDSNHRWETISTYLSRIAMKKRLADGLCRIYQIAHCFRGEEIGPHHAMGFRMLEWYRVGASWWDIAHETMI